jgi:serine/threonine protein kinase
MTTRRRFHVRRQIGEGSFGRVYLCEQESSGGFKRTVALKVLRTDVGGRAMREAARRMRDEARLLGRLSHRSIVGVLDLVQLEAPLSASSTLGGAGGHVWAVVMEHVDGPDLERVVEALESDSSSLPVGCVVELGGQIADAMHAAWSAPDGEGGTLGVVHRDIKPSNVMLTASGDVRVLDFGVARMNLDDREGHTGVLVGTRRYMAPERLSHQTDTTAGDIYALGATLYELLALEPLGDSPLEIEPHTEMVAQAVHRLSDIHPELAQLVGRMLAFHPGARPDARQVVRRCDDLRAEIEGDSLRSWARAFVPRVDRLAPSTQHLLSFTYGEVATGSDAESVVTPVPPPSPPAPQPTPQPTPQRADRSMMWSMLAGGLAAAAVLLVGQVPLALGALGGADPAVVDLHSSPPGAEVWRGTHLLGHTPLELRGEALLGAEVTLVLDGHGDATVMLPDQGRMSVALSEGRRNN